MHARNPESHSFKDQAHRLDGWSQSLFSNLPSPLRYACVAFGLLTVGEPPARAYSAEGTPQWVISFIDRENCSVRDLKTGEVYTAQAAIIRDQLATPEGRAMVQFEGEYPSDWRSIITQTESPSAWPSNSGAQTAPEEQLRLPTKQDAIAHTALLRNSSFNQGLTLLSSNSEGSEWEVSGVRFVFRSGDLLSCVVHAPGVHPYRITGLGRSESDQATTRASKTTPFAAEQESIHATQAVRRSLYQALSTYCKQHTLTTNNRTPEGIWNILVPVNGEQILFTLSNLGKKEWQVSGPGFAPFTLEGIPYSVAAQIFHIQGNHKLAQQYAQKAGISLSPSQIPPQPIEHAATQQIEVQNPARQDESNTSHDEHIDTKEYFRLLSDHCKTYALSSKNLVNGSYHIEVESNQGTVLFDLKDREAKLWRVESPGSMPFWMTGIPTSVAARIFHLEGNLTLATTLAKKADITLEDQGQVSQERGVADVPRSKQVPTAPPIPTITVEDDAYSLKDGKVRISESYNMATFHANTNAAALNQVLKGVLTGKGEKFIYEATKNGLCPLALVAISVHESDNGCSDMAKGELHNVFGIYDSANNKYREFESVDDCIAYTAKLLGGVGYVKGEKNPRQTIAEIQEKYCPVGAANDPKKLNKHWRTGVVGWMRILNGGDEALVASAQKRTIDFASN